MNTTELIEIAKECCFSRQVVGDETALITFRSEQLQQLAQRIEQPLHQQIKRLREALGLLLDCAIHGYDMPEDHSYAIISRNALEQTK